MSHAGVRMKTVKFFLILICYKKQYWINNIRDTGHLSNGQLTYWQNAWHDIWRSDKCRKAYYIKHCTCAKPEKHKRFSLLIGLNDVVHHECSYCNVNVLLCNFPPFVPPDVILDGPTNGSSIVAPLFKTESPEHEKG